MAKIFICYRRADCEDMAGRIRDRLRIEFSASEVFMDVDSEHYGEELPDELRAAVTDCEVFLALIGSDWLSIQNKKGQRRLDNPQDYVRFEIEVALQDSGKILPVLIRGAEMPDEDDLPQTLRKLAPITGPRVRSGSDFDSDVDRLQQAIRRVMAKRDQARRDRVASERQQIEREQRDGSRQQSETRAQPDVQIPTSPPIGADPDAPVALAVWEFITSLWVFIQVFAVTCGLGGVLWSSRTPSKTMARRSKCRVLEITPRQISRS